MNSSANINESLVSLTEDIIDEDIDMYLEIQRKLNAQVELVVNIFTEIFTVLGIVNLCANIIIAYAIIKYKKLRMEKSNIIIFNFTVLDSLFTICLPIAIRYRQHYGFSWIVCLVVEIEFTLSIGSILIITLLTIHWYIKTYHPVHSEIFNKRVSLLIACTYVLIAFCTGLGADDCAQFQSGLYFIVRYGVLVFIALYALTMIVINILHIVKRKTLIANSRNVMYLLILSNTFFLTKLPVSIATSIELIFPFSYEYHLAVVIAMFCGTTICLMNGLYFLIILYLFGNDHKTLFRHILSCKRDGYTEEMLEPRVVYNDTTVLVED